MYKPNCRQIVLGFFALLASVAPAQTASAPSTPAEKEIYAIYKSSLKADELLGLGSYQDAAKSYDDSLEKLVKAIRQNPDARYWPIPVAANELTTIRNLGLSFQEIAKPGVASIVTTRFAELLEEGASVARQVIGADPNWPDDSILNKFTGVVKAIELPIPDEEALSASIRLKVTVDALESLLKRSPKYGRESMRGITGKEALDQARKMLAEVSEQAKGAASKLAAKVPEQVVLERQIFRRDVDSVKKSIEEKGFVSDDLFERYILQPQEFVARMEKNVQDSYRQEGKTPPADVMKPILDGLAEIKETALKNAPRFTFPTDLVASPEITNSVKAQLQKNLKGIAILKIGMRGQTWNIVKNDIGIPESRYREGIVLYQMPNEKWARCSVFIYRETYAGGGRYEKASGASSYPATRWQQAK